ncbi:aldo/keto reductase [bacterium]|nr:aldo/keto reductase [candidate division CSSED10-310 bacterium]
MKTMTLGKTGLTVSRVGIGGIPIQRPLEDDAVRVIQHALDLGITFIDTAIAYGVSEGRIGKALAGRRQQVILTTKTPATDKATALLHLDYSLRRLNTDYLDIWQIHNISDDERYDQVLAPGGFLEAAQEAEQAGKIRYAGMSSHSLDVSLKAAASGHFDTIQYPLNFISTEAVDTLIPLAKEHDVGFIAMKPFAGGHIRDAGLAMKYLLQFPTALPDPGIETIEDIDQIVAIVESGDHSLSSQEWSRIEKIRSDLGTSFCRQCGYCMPCPQGVQIPMVMITRIMWKLWPKELFVDPEGWFVQGVKTAENCTKCGECESKCPYKLHIRDAITDNWEFYKHVTADQI